MPGETPPTDREILAECLKLLRKHDEILETFRPLLERFVISPVATRRATRRKMKHVGGVSIPGYEEIDTP